MSSIQNLVSSIKNIKRPGLIYFAVLLNLIYVLANIPLIISIFTSLIGMKAFNILTNHSTELLIITYYCGRALFVMTITYGILTLHRWAWFIQLAFSLLIIYCLLMFFYPLPITFLLQADIPPVISIIWGILNLIIIVSFLTKGVRDAFFTEQPSREDYLDEISKFKEPKMTYRNIIIKNYGNTIKMDFSTNLWIIIPVWVGLFFGWFITTIIISINLFAIWVIAGIVLTFIAFMDEKTLLIDSKERKIIYKTRQWAFFRSDKTFDFNEINENGFYLSEKDVNPILMIIITYALYTYNIDTTLGVLLLETKNNEDLELIAFETIFIPEVDKMIESANKLLLETEQSERKKKQGLL